jgi:predicted ATPase
VISCECVAVHARQRIVLTGGPGAGKTAVLELIRQSFCEHIKVLPEAAGIVFGGGFPREDDITSKQAAQRAIFYVQRELEHTADSHNTAMVLCDRGTIDGLAYWPGAIDDFWSSLNTTAGEQLARYHAVIHLRTPAVEHGYNQQNPLRTESATVAAEIDRRIHDAWGAHPRRFIVESTAQFLDKAAKALDILRGEMPACCRHHVIAALHDRDVPTRLPSTYVMPPRS